MRTNRISRPVLAAFLLVAVTVPTALADPSYYITLGSDTPHTYNGIPFEVGGVDDLDVYQTDELVETASIDLSGYTTTKIHILETAAWATYVPDGVVVGYITVHYEDGSHETLDLVMGVNISEWAYDRVENQSILQHTKVPPAYSYWTNIDSAEYYWGHHFYVEMATQAKPLDYLELTLDPASYAASVFGWFGISITAMTLEVASESPEVMLSELTSFITSEVEAGNIDPELEASLLAKVNGAIAALDKGNPNDVKTAMNKLKALVNHVEAQADKKITSDAAAAIILRVNGIIAALGG